MRSSEASDAALGGIVGRDECETYARVAEPKKQGVGSMFDEELLDFVSNYRRSEGKTSSYSSTESTASNRNIRWSTIHKSGAFGKYKAQSSFAGFVMANTKVDFSHVPKLGVTLVEEFEHDPAILAHDLACESA